MYPFLTALIDKILSAMNMDDPEIKAFDVFNIHADVTDSEREEKATALFEFYGWTKTSNLQGDSNEAGAILSTDICDDERRLFFYEDFDLAKNEAAEKRNRLILELICKKELKVEYVATYKCEHPLLPRTFTKLHQKILTFTQISWNF